QCWINRERDLVPPRSAVVIIIVVSVGLRLEQPQTNPYTWCLRVDVASVSWGRATGRCIASCLSHRVLNPRGVVPRDYLSVESDYLSVERRQSRWCGLDPKRREWERGWICS
ncbi:MAG: hypothetical protein GY820_18435, partial [Gammaproteobacteria bacterium]|nr:hypothetical protein [Gammaproteobacteria bacterium]